MKRSEIYLKAAEIIKRGDLSEIIIGASPTSSGSIYACWAIAVVAFGKLDHGKKFYLNIHEFPEFELQRPSGIGTVGGGWFSEYNSTYEQVRDNRIAALIRASELAKDTNN